MTFFLPPATVVAVFLLVICLKYAVGSTNYIIKVFLGEGPYALLGYSIAFLTSNLHTHTLFFNFLFFVFYFGFLCLYHPC